MDFQVEIFFFYKFYDKNTKDETFHYIDLECVLINERFTLI